MSMVRCSQCGTAFSSHRTVCPNCGMERNKGGARLKPKSGNAKTVVTVLLIVAIIICLAILAFIMFKDKGDDSGVNSQAQQTDASQETQPTDSLPETTPAVNIDNAETITGNDESDSETTPESIPADNENSSSESDTPEGNVTEIKLNVYATSPDTNQYDMSLAIGESYGLIASTSPDSVSVTWTSSDEAVAQISSDGTVVGTSAGTAIVTASVGDVKTECIVRVG